MTTNTPKKHRKHPHHHKHHPYRAELVHPVAQQPHDPNPIERIGEGINYVGNGISAAITSGIEGAARGIAGAGGAAYKAMQNGFGGEDRDAAPPRAEQSPPVAPIPYDARAASPSAARIRSIDAQPKRIPILAEKQEVVETRTGKRNKINKKTPVTSETIDLRF